MKTSYENQVVWIIGASSGIGLALARELSMRGAILALSARRLSALEQLKSELGDRHSIFILDITDAEATLRTVDSVHTTFGRIDRIVFLAAAYTPMKIEAINITVAKHMIEVNLTSAFNLLHAVLPIFKTQKTKGQIALCGSVAGYVGLPGGQPYSATKAAIINLSESLYAECGDLIDIKLINPGFVRTPLTDKNNFKMPLLLEPEEAAKKIAEGLQTKRFEIHFPKKLTVFLKVLRLLPYAFSLRLIRMIKL